LFVPKEICDASLLADLRDTGLADSVIAGRYREQENICSRE
jgi:hypothetical protein